MIVADLLFRHFPLGRRRRRINGFSSMSSRPHLFASSACQHSGLMSAVQTFCEFFLSSMPLRNLLDYLFRALWIRWCAHEA